MSSRRVVWVRCNLCDALANTSMELDDRDVQVLNRLGQLLREDSDWDCELSVVPEISGQEHLD